MKRDYREIAMRSVKQTLKRNGIGCIRQPPDDAKRVKDISSNSQYYKYRRYIVGKLVKKVGEGISGDWYAFIHDSDRQALNKVAELSNDREKYMFDGIKFE